MATGRPTSRDTQDREPYVVTVAVKLLAFGHGPDAARRRSADKVRYGWADIINIKTLDVRPASPDEMDTLVGLGIIDQ